MQDEINFLKKKRDDLKEKLENMCPCQPTGSTCGKFQLDDLFSIQPVYKIQH